MNLVQVDCGDLCGPHAWCPACQALTCQHTIALLFRVDDVRAAILALPTRSRRHVAYRPAHPHVLAACPWRRSPCLVRVCVTPTGWVINRRLEWLGLN